MKHLNPPSFADTLRLARLAAASGFWLLSATFLCVAAACDPAPERRPQAAPSAKSSAAASAEPIASAEKPLKSDRADRTHRAGRCGECHEKMYDEWTASAHAKADDSPAYVAMRKQAREPSCERCHAPLALLNEPAAFAAREAVSCEVCHRIEQVTVEEPFARMQLLAAHEVKFGPRCDPSDPYFHRARCSPLFKKSELCASCHQLYQPGMAGTSLPVHTEYSDFLKSPYAARGKSCQSCHMPGVRSELAIGERERDGVPDHGFLGDRGKLRGSALKVAASAAWKPGHVELTLRLTNERAGHAIPAGSPGRQLVVQVSALDETGRELSREERAFGRRLVDAEGRAAPFYAAARLDSDSRLQPRETRREVFAFELGGVRQLRVLVAFRAIEPELGRRLELPADELVKITETSIAVGPKQRGSRAVSMRR